MARILPSNSNGYAILRIMNPRWILSLSPDLTIHRDPVPAQETQNTIESVQGILV